MLLTGKKQEDSNIANLRLTEVGSLLRNSLLHVLRMRSPVTGRMSFLLIIMLTTVLSCKPEFDFENIKTDNLESQWGIPLVSSQLTLSDFLNDSSESIHFDENGAISVIYESDELFSIQAWERTQIPNQIKTVNETFDIDDLKSLVFDPIPVGFHIPLDLTSPDQRIDSMFLRNGEYRVTISTNLNRESASIHLRIPNFIHRITKDTLSFSFDMSNPNEYPLFTKDTLISLVDYNAWFRNDPYGIIPLNTIVINSMISYDFDSLPNLSPYNITLESQLIDIEYFKFYGYIGQHVELYSDTIDLNIFNSVDFGSINFSPDAVHLTLDFFNELSIPLQIEATSFVAYHSNQENTDSVEVFLDFGSGTSNRFEIFSPACNDESVVFTSRTPNQSNIIDALKIAPNKVYFELNGLFNPDGDDMIPNCFKDTSDIGMQVTVELDLFGSLTNFTMTDTIDFSIDDIENLVMVDFYTIILNGFPVDMIAQIEFLDDDHNLLTNLFAEDESFINAGTTGGAPLHKVISPAIKETTITIGDESLKSIFEATQFVFKVTMNTTNSQIGEMVKIYSDYQVELSLSAKVLVHY